MWTLKTVTSKRSFSKEGWENHVKGKLLTLSPIRLGEVLEVSSIDGKWLATSSLVQDVITIGTEMRVQTMNTVLVFKRVG